METLVHRSLASVFDTFAVSKVIVGHRAIYFEKKFNLFRICESLNTCKNVK